MSLLNVSILLRLLLALHALRFTTKAIDINCLQLPMKELEICCRFPNMKLELFDKKCRHLMNKNIISEIARYAQPCVVACIYEVNRILDANFTLQKPRLRQFTAQIIEDKKFQDVYYNGMSTCEPLVLRKWRKSMNRSRDDWKRRRFGGGNCSKVPFYYGICTQTEVFINCPPSKWMKSEQCNKTRDFMKNCVQKSF